MLDGLLEVKDNRFTKSSLSTYVQQYYQQHCVTIESE